MTDKPTAEHGASAPSAGALVRRTRAELAWVDEADLIGLEHREPATALAWSMTGGGGLIYAGDRKQGVIGCVALVAALVVAPILPASIAAVPALGVIVWGAISSWAKSRAVNRYLANQLHAQSNAHAHAAPHGLLAAMPAQEALAVPRLKAKGQEQQPGEHSEVVARLKQLAAIRSSGVVDASEHRSRKIDILSDIGAGLDAVETETLLFALLPLLDDGTISNEDIEFIKELGS